MAVFTAAPTKQGDTLYVGIFIHNTSDVPTNADSTPTFTAYAGADLSAKANPITGFTVTAITGEAGGYVISKSTAALSAGTNYWGILSYLISTAARRDMVAIPIV